MKKNTIRNLVFLVFVIIVASCKKDATSSDNDSYVKFKLNGNWVTYKGLGELGPDLGDASKTDLGVNGYSDDKKSSFSISIQIDGSDFKTGTYSSDQYLQYYMIVDFTSNPDPSTAKYYEISDAIDNNPSKYIVNITSITPTQIKGTFTGNYLYDSFHDDNDPDGGIVYITEGQFQVKRVR
ncbi:MAG TPA: hypothetical protein VFI29_08945 [Hanamia sp.]|nr:hypothetical protein [Hanamia sp.]